MDIGVGDSISAGGAFRLAVFSCGEGDGVGYGFLFRKLQPLASGGLGASKGVPMDVLRLLTIAGDITVLGCMADV